MFPSLNLSSSHFSHAIIHGILRWIVVAEIFQNAWSFAVCNAKTEPGSVILRKRSRPSRRAMIDCNDEDEFNDLGLGGTPTREANIGPHNEFFQSSSLPYHLMEALEYESKSGFESATVPLF